MRAPTPARARSAGDVAFGLACWVVTCVLGIPVWLAVLALPRLSWRWRLARWSGRALRALLRVPVAIAGTPPATGPAVVVANHSSYLDAFVLFVALDAPATFVAGGALARQVVVGTFLRRVGCIFVATDRAAPPGAALEALEEALRRGARLVVFPEGRLAREPGLGRFRLGAFVAALHTGAPVVPVAIGGTRAMLPAGGRLPRRGAIRVTFHAPLVAGSDDDGWRAARALAEQARQAVAGALGG